MKRAETPLEPLLLVVGPTASGKSELALKIAERFDGEIVSADSVQLYRYFDVGSGKPTDEERQRAPHHGIDVVDPDEDVDASRFAELARGWIEAIRARGRVPIVCGGTFLWVRALLFGLAEAPAKDDGIRERHRAMAAERGRAALHEWLRDVDPKSAERLNPNDFVRVSRALEVYELTGRPLSELQREHGFARARYAPLFVGIRHDADKLTARIRARVESMLRRGFELEVRDLCRRGYRQVRPMKSVGYRQVLAAVESTSPPPREELVDAITRATRIFARRQRTWLREEAVTWLAPADAERALLPRVVVDEIRA